MSILIWILIIGIVIAIFIIAIKQIKNAQEIANSIVKITDTDWNIIFIQDEWITINYKDWKIKNIYKSKIRNIEFDPADDIIMLVITTIEEELSFQISKEEAAKIFKKSSVWNKIEPKINWMKWFLVWSILALLASLLMNFVQAENDDEEENNEDTNPMEENENEENIDEEDNSKDKTSKGFFGDFFDPGSWWDFFDSGSWWDFWWDWWD